MAAQYFVFGLPAVGRKPRALARGALLHFYSSRIGNIVVEKIADYYYDIGNVTVCNSNRWMKRFVVLRQ